MRRNPLLLIMSAFFAIIFIASCQKETEPGEPGPQGPPGPAGPQGPKGDTGVANVIYSDWIDVDFAWLLDANDDTLGTIGSIDAPKLSADIVNKGVVKVYVNQGTAAEPFVTTLPYLSQFTGLLVTPYISEGQIDMLGSINYFEYPGTFTDQDNNKLNQYRYVLIPPGVLAAKPANVNLDNYSDAKKYLKIK